MRMINDRYAIRCETADGTLEEPFHHMTRKDWALKSARNAAKCTVRSDVVRVWVDDTNTGLGVQAFEVKR